MQGSLRLGEEVVDKISHYFPGGNVANGRRSLGDHSDFIADEVKSSFLCRKLAICQNELKNFIDDYVIALIKAVNSIIDETISTYDLNGLSLTTTFKKNLENILHEIRKILKKVNMKLTDENETYSWISVIKNISGLLTIKSTTYVIDAIVNKEKDISIIKKTLIQNIVVGVAETEMKFQTLICKKYGICMKSVECSKALNSVLEHLIQAPESKIQVFMKAITEMLPEINFYSRLDQVTASEFQIILHDMAFTNHVPSKDILKSVKKAVDSRLRTDDSKEKNAFLSHDVLLIHGILSDMDFFLSRHKVDPFHVFLDDFVEWVKLDIRINSFLKKLFKNIQDILQKGSDEIVTKLTYEVRVFLELTVDPDPEKTTKK